MCVGYGAVANLTVFGPSALPTDSNLVDFVTSKLRILKARNIPSATIPPWLVETMIFVLTGSISSCFPPVIRYDRFLHRCGIYTMTSLRDALTQWTSHSSFHPHLSYSSGWWLRGVREKCVVSELGWFSAEKKVALPHRSAHPARLASV